MSKAIKSVVRLMVPAGQAKPAPPVGPALGQAGLNIMSFCKDFNAKTADIKVRDLILQDPTVRLSCRRVRRP